MIITNKANDWITASFALIWIITWFIAVPAWFVYHSPWGGALALMGFFALSLGLLSVDGERR